VDPIETAKVLAMLRQNFIFTIHEKIIRTTKLNQAIVDTVNPPDRKWASVARVYNNLYASSTIIEPVKNSKRPLVEKKLSRNKACYWLPQC